MQIFESIHNKKKYIQIYLTKEELKDRNIQEKINTFKSSKDKVAVFVSGENEYIKILERIILFELEKNNNV